IEDPIRRALTEALVPHGHRVASLRGATRAALELDGRALRLVAGGAGEPAGASAALRAQLEEARVIAPVLAALADDREDVARAAARELESKGAALPALATLARELEHAAGARGRGGAPVDPGLGLRLALAARD